MSQTNNLQASNLSTESLPEFVTSSEICRILRISKPSLLKSVASGQFPKPIVVGKKSLRFNRNEVLAFLQNREVGND